MHNLPKISETLEKKIEDSNGNSKFNVLIFGAGYNFQGYKEKRCEKSYFHFSHGESRYLNQVLNELKKSGIQPSGQQCDFGYVHISSMTKKQVEYFANQDYVGTILSEDDLVWLC